ncbi:MAG: OmpA family protein [Porphyromonas sp.]|nr:OmpA family protein [Porphyromonas sp.]
MIKKSLLVLATLGAAAQLVSAQTDSVYTETRTEDKHRVVTNRFGSNWEIGFGVGGNMLFGDHDKQMKFLDRLGLNGGIHVAKWFTPGLGLRVGAFGGMLPGVSGYTGHALDYPNVNYGNYQGFIKKPYDFYQAAPKGHYGLLETQEKYVNIHGDVLFNLSNLIGGYKETRFYSFIPFVSVGFALSLDNAVNGNKTHEVTGGVGLLNRFRLSKALDLNVEVRGTYVSDRFDQEYVAYNQKANAYQGQAGRWGEGVLSATVGLSYKIPRRGWDNVVERTLRVNDNLLNDLRNRVGALTNENDDLRRQLENALNREVTRENVSAQPLLVTFPIDRWTLSNKDRVNLGFLAEAIKSNPGVVYSVTGYADQGTGSVKRNIFLARKRSEVIYDCLVNEFGVSESQLRRDDKGGVENMYYNDPRCSRAVLLKVAE